MQATLLLQGFTRGFVGVFVFQINRDRGSFFRDLDKLYRGLIAIISWSQNAIYNTGDATLQNVGEIRARRQNGEVHKPNDAICEVTGRRHRVSPCRSAYRSQSLVITHFKLQKTQESSSFIIPRVVMASDDVELSPVSFHDYLEYKTPSQQYENGLITYF